MSSGEAEEEAKPEVVRSIFRTAQTLAKADQISTEAALIQFLALNGYSVSKVEDENNQNRPQTAARSVIPVVLSWRHHGLSSSTQNRT